MNELSMIRLSGSDSLWFNATEAAEKHGKRVDKFWASRVTKDAIKELDLNSPSIGELKRVILGKGKEQGTFIHQELASTFLWWVDKKRNGKRKESDGLYLLSDGRAFKIGVTSDMDSRLRGIQTGNPFKVTVVKYTKIKNAVTIETILHSSFADKRMMGEWFDLSKDDVARCLKIMKENRYE